MKTNFIATDVGLSIPVIIFPIGHVGGKSIDVLSSLHGLSFNCSLNSEKYPDLLQICQSKNVILPNEIRSTIFVLNDESDFSKIRLRFLLEPSLSFLKWFVAVIFIDQILNNDIKSLQEYAKTFSISLDLEHINFFIFSYNTPNNNNRNTTEKFKTDKHLFFFFLDNNVNDVADKNESALISSVIDNSIDFLCPLIIQSIQNQMSAIVAPENVFARKKTRSNKVISAIPRITLSFLSTNLPDKIKIFNETYKLFEDGKSIDYQKNGEIFELLGILEIEHPGTSKKYQLLDRVSNNSHWEIDDKNDALLIFAIAGSYFMKNLPSRALDCCFRILSYYVNGQTFSSATVGTTTSSNNSFLLSNSSSNLISEISCSTKAINSSVNNLNPGNNKTVNFVSNKTITFMINECILIIERLNDEDMMQNRGIELITLISRLGQIRKIPMVCYQISKILRYRAKADFLLMGIKFLYEQNICKNSELIIQKLAEPMAETLLKSFAFPLEKCSIIFKILSTIGDFLPKEKQDFLFMKMIDLSIGDVRIPCNIGLKVSYAKIITPAIEIIKVNKADKTKSNSVFLYNGLLSQANHSLSEGYFSYSGSESTIGVGFQFRIEFDLYNPFSLDLPVFISCAKINHCSSEDYPFPLKAKTNNKLVCCLIPVDENEITIDSVDCVIYSGVQRIVFPYPLKIKAIDGVASFSVRTILPIKQVLELFDGEVYHVKMWVTNTGSCAINNLVLRFDPAYLKLRNEKKPIYNEDEIPKLIQPCENVQINLKFNIISSMESISFDVVAQTSLNKGYEAVYHIEQPIKVKVGVCINSVSLLKNLPEPRFDLSKLVFVGVNIQNHTDDTFNYTASFKYPSLTDSTIDNDNNNDDIEKACEVGGEFLSILSSKPRKGLLIGFETTTLIISIPKSIIENPPIRADRTLKIAAARDEEAKIGKRLTNRQRMMLDLRVDMAEFIKYSLNFKWQRGSVRKGNLAMSSALPSEELLEEFQIKRPQTIYSFKYIEDDKKQTEINDDDEQLKTVCVKRKVALNIRFKLAPVKKCKIDLGVFDDSDYGIMWNGSLACEKDDDDKSSNFYFIFYFARPGNFTFKVEYETFESIKGFYPLNANVVDN